MGYDNWYMKNVIIRYCVLVNFYTQWDHYSRSRGSKWGVASCSIYLGLHCDSDVVNDERGCLHELGDAVHIEWCIWWQDSSKCRMTRLFTGSHQIE